jgi:hypothetical protein
MCIQLFWSLNSEVSLLFLLSSWHSSWWEVTHYYCVGLCVCKSSRVCLMKLCVLIFFNNCYLLLMNCSLINMKWPCLSLLTNFVLKSVLKDMDINTPVFSRSICLNVFFHPVTQCLSLSVRCLLVGSKWLGLAFFFFFFWP